MPRVPLVNVRRGDCLSVLKGLDNESANLVYLDPPFFTRRVHRLSPRDRSREFSFADQWKSQQHYAEFLWPRLQQCCRVLASDGSVFFHCDRNATHIVRAMLDDVLGSRHFRAEIIWHYRRWSNSRRGLLPTHQTILYYTKSDSFTFNEVRTDYSPATNIDQILQRRSRDAAKKSVYERDADGQVITGGIKSGVPLGDVWDIPYLNPKAKERNGYPTQKPLLLLERIISLASNPGDCVLDPFCGSGTTLVAAKSLGRRALGIDVSADAVTLARQRLKLSARTRSRLVEAGRDSYANADQTALALLQGLDFVPVHRNRGIDAILRTPFAGGPVPIRVQRSGESLYDAARLLARAASSKQAKLMFLIAIETRTPREKMPAEVIVVEAPALQIRERTNSVS